jgi:hypothetical protein
MTDIWNVAAARGDKVNDRLMATILMFSQVPR